MDENKEFGDEKSARQDFEGDSSRDAPSKDVASKAEDFGPNEKSDSTTPTEDAVADVEHEYISGLKLFLAMTGITLVIFLMMLDMSIIVTAIPRITSDFHSLPDVGWYGSVFLLASCAVGPTTGKLYTQFNSKFTFLAFLFLFEIGSALCGAAVSSNMLIIGRAVAGLGGSGLINGSLTIIAAALPNHKRPAMVGVVMSFSQLGVLSGPLIGGALTQYASWRWCFYINLPIGGLAALLLFFIHIPDRLIKDSAEKKTARSVLSELDLVGFSLFAPFTIMMLMALQWGGEKYPWSSPTIIGLFCGGGGALLAFLAWEFHFGERAMIPFSVLRQRVVWSSCLVGGFFFGSLLMFSYYLPIYFQTVKGATPTMSGVYMLPSVLSQMITAVLSGVLVGKLGYYTPWAMGSGIVVSISAGLMSTLRPNTSNAKWIGYQILMGLGRGAGMQMPIVAIQNVVKPSHIPIGMALMMFSQQFGGGFFLAVAQVIFSHGLEEGLGKFAPNVDAQTVIAAGATAVRNVIGKADLPNVLKAFNYGINHCFYLAVGCSAAVFVAAFGMGFGKVKKEEKKKTEPVVEV